MEAFLKKRGAESDVGQYVSTHLLPVLEPALSGLLHVYEELLDEEADAVVTPGSTDKSIEDPQSERAASGASLWGPLSSFDPLVWLAEYLRNNNPNRVRNTADEEVALSTKVALFSQDIFTEVDKHASVATADDECNVLRLAAYLTSEYSPCNSRTDRARAIYWWICHKVSVDLEYYCSSREVAASSASLSKSDAKTVLDTRVANSEGFASLFHRLAQLAGLACKKVYGWCRFLTHAYEDVVHCSSENQSQLYHVWNVVKIGSEWQVVDCMFGSGFFVPALENAAPKQFRKIFRPFFFCPPPPFAVYSHFPTTDARMQLLSAPISKNDFQGRPFVFPAFWEHGLKFIDLATGECSPSISSSSVSGVSRVESHSMFGFAVPLGLDLRIRIESATGSAVHTTECENVSHPGPIVSATNSARSHSSAGHTHFRSSVPQIVETGSNRSLVFLEEIQKDAGASGGVESPSDQLAIVFLQRHDELVSVDILWKYADCFNVYIDSLEVDGGGTGSPTSAQRAHNAEAKGLAGIDDNDQEGHAPVFEGTIVDAPVTSPEDIWHTVCHFQVTAESGIGGSNALPMFFDVYDVLRGHLYEPLLGEIRGSRRSLERVKFKICLCGVDDVAVVSESVDEWSHLERRAVDVFDSHDTRSSVDLVTEGFVFEGTADVYPGVVSVHAKLEGENRYTRVLQYEACVEN